LTERCRPGAGAARHPPTGRAGSDGRVGSDGARARLGHASVEDHVLHSELACEGGIMVKENISRPATGGDAARMRARRPVFRVTPWSGRR
jgi:hypothetical protein